MKKEYHKILNGVKFQEFDPDIAKMGHFIIFRGQGLFRQHLIEKEQLGMGYDTFSSKFTHVEVCGGGFDSMGASLPLSKLHNLVKEYAGREAIIVTFKAKDYETKGRYKVAFFAASRANLKFGVKSFLWFKYHNLFSKDKDIRKNSLANIDRPFCSFLALWALQKQYPKACDIYPENSVPADFLNPKYFKCVWHGMIPKK